MTSGSNRGRNVSRGASSAVKRGTQFPLHASRHRTESDRNRKLLFADNTPDGLLKLLTGPEPTE